MLVKQVMNFGHRLWHDAWERDAASVTHRPPKEAGCAKVAKAPAKDVLVL